MKQPDHKKVLVVGGGIAGVQASLDLGDSGVEVYLVERGPSIGGRMAQLDKTFPTNDCAMCILSPKLVEAGSHPYINIITNAEVVDVTGEAPHFKATILKHPRYVDEAKCTGCGICVAKCPVKIPDEYNKSLNKTKCIRIPFPQAIPPVALIDEASCIYLQRGKCRVCEKFCDAGAIDFEQLPETSEVEVGSVILAAGSKEFDAVFKDEYGYKTFPNVITSIELERMMSASGPTQGHIYRPSDQTVPKKVAFVQCVGSRDLQVERDYCSAICCMQATKDAVILSEHVPDTESTVFCMDIRAYGKDFDRYIERAEKEHNTRFLRARISSVEIDPTNDNLVVQYSLDGQRIQKDSFELLVLSVGLESSPAVKALTQKLGVALNSSGFVSTSSFTPVSTSRPGVFVCGSLSGPRDIPEAVMGASGAASAASCLLTEFPVKEIKVEYPPEKDVRGDPPRIGVFVCHCGINIASTVDVAHAVEYASGLPRVVHAEELLFACSQDAQKVIGQAIEEKELNRVIVAACTPRTHEPLFQKTLKEVGLNPYLFEFANIREQCSWVHQKVPDDATGKAKDLIRMAASKASLLEPLSKMRLGVDNRALVIGGGLAGMVASLDLADQGYGVYLVEREGQLGGNLRHISYTLEGEKTDPFLTSLIERVRSNEKVEVFTGTEVSGVSGFVGNFRSTLTKSKAEAARGTGRPSEIEHGIVVVATGAEEYEPDEHLYGQDQRVITQRQLGELIAEAESGEETTEGSLASRLSTLNSVVMIQCVGSRDDDRPYCSRVCCSAAVKHALRLKEINPDARVFILYRDVRTYGLKELYYKLARERGVVFVRYDENEKPVVEKDQDQLSVKVTDAILGRKMLFSPDLLVLSAGIVANQGNKVLSQLLKVPLDSNGFFLEAHVKLRPVDFATDGVFVCGLAHYPKDAAETIAQARAAAARSATILSKSQIEAEGKVSLVDEWKCTGCGLCVELCPYKAIELEDKKVLGQARVVAVVNEALCKGCGACAASCRSGSIDLKGFADAEVMAQIEALVG